MANRPSARVLRAVGLACLALIGLEAGLFVLGKAGALRPRTRASLLRLAEQTSHPALQSYIAHPYFGYVYTPNNKFFQDAHYMESNSEGFIDKEFPSGKEPGVCVYGLLGGSAAMSWGMESDAQRVSSLLERRLNAEARDGRCRAYRVLNMGVGSHIQAQASHIYMRYQDLLDGAIFLVGNNECSQLSCLWDDDPEDFPVVKDYQLHLAMNRPAQAVRARRNIHDAAAFFATRPRFYRLNSAKALCELYLRFNAGIIQRLNDSVRAKEHAAAGDSPLLRRIDPSPYEQSLRQSGEAAHFLAGGDPALQAAALKRILPKVFTEPLIAASAIARAKRAGFLLLIQPMPGAMDLPSPYQSLTYQRVGHQALHEEARKLSRYGIRTHDLNDEESLFRSVKGELFMDWSHLTAEGNRVLADRIFELVRSEWKPGV